MSLRNRRNNRFIRDHRVDEAAIEASIRDGVELTDEEAGGTPVELPKEKTEETKLPDTP